MTCPGYDWKGYVLKELEPGERARAEVHLGGCAACQAEVEGLELTVAALERLPAVEIPRRIGFVSDPVFEQPWWKRMWTSGPQLGFAGAALVALAIVAHGAMAQRPAVNEAEVAKRVEERVQSEVAKRVEAEVAARVQQGLQAGLQPVRADLEAKLEGLEKRHDARRQSDMAAVESAFTHMEKKMNTAMVTAARYGGD